MKLFDLLPEHKALFDLIDEQPGGELSPDVEQSLDRFFAEIGEAESVKLESYAGLIRTLEGAAAVAQAEIDRFAMAKRTAENAVKRLKDRVKAYLELTSRTQVKTAMGRTFAIQNNGGKLPLDITIPATDLPARFQRVTVSANEDAIREVLESGEPLEFATLKPRGSHLRLR